MAARNYRIKMSRGDVQLEAEGDKAFVLAMLKRFERGGVPEPSTPSPSATGKSADPGTVASSKTVSIGEFIRQFGFKKHTDMVLAFGYYLEQHSGQKTFTAADISNCYYEAKIESSNISQSLFQNVRRGVIMEAKGAKGVKGAKNYTLTQTGEAHLKKVAKAGTAVK